uniref:THAP-type domain-containing protein n=1 Tax=Heliothis virescens TaxID=7102 RepID=A0A2A4JZ36_HELVI
MVTYCCVKDCGNNSNKTRKNSNSVISFHALPSNPELRAKWLRAVGRPNWTAPSYAKVCSVHFDLDQINYDGHRVRLKDDAVPLNLLPEPGIKFNKSDRPIYNRTRCLKPKVKKPKPKRKKRNNNEDTPVPDEPYVQRFFNITETPVRASVKKYSCKSCSATFQYPEEAKDHTFIGCPKLQHSGIAAPNAASSLPEPDAHKPKPKHWETWPGSN